MEVIKTNPDIETLKLTLWIATGVISMLLVIVAFFLKKQVGVSETLTKAVNDLNNVVTVLQTKEEERHPVTQRMLNEHADRLDKHDIKLAKIETILKIKHNEED